MRIAPRALMRLATLSAIALTLPLAGRLAAQTAANADSVTVITRDSIPAASQNAPAATSQLSGAPLTGLRSGVHARETARSMQPNAAATHANLGQSKAMMIVGGAALITGAVIGGDAGTLIMVGGAVIGLYGLYQYLQ